MKTQAPKINIAKITARLRAITSFLLSDLICLSLVVSLCVQDARADKRDTDASGRETDYKYPVRDGNAPDGNEHWHVTVCRPSNGKNDYTLPRPAGTGHGELKAEVEPKHVLGGTGESVASANSVDTDGKVSLHGYNPGDADFKITYPTKPPVVKHITVHVIECPDATLHHRGIASALSPLGEGGADMAHGLASWSGTPSHPVASEELKPTTIGIVVPQDLPAGQMVTGSVVTNPEQYKNVPGLQVVEGTVMAPASGSLEGMVVDTGDGKPQSALKPILIATAIGGVAAALTLSLLDHPELPPVTTKVPVAPPVSRPTNTGETETQIPPVKYSTPGFIENKVQEIQGPLSGDSRLTTATLDGRSATVLAAKPGAVYLDTSAATTPGLHQIVLHPAGQEPVSLTSRFVQTSASVSSTVLHRGQSAEMSLTVNAGQVSPSDGGTVSVKLVNQTPGVIKIAGSPELTFTASELAKGPVTKQVKLQAVSEGSFGVSWVTTPQLKPSTAPADPAADNLQFAN